ncbi:hypothetical protein V2J09_013389 [Rumex salicifolius]
MEVQIGLKVKKLEKQVSFSEETYGGRKMEKQSSFRKGEMEKQKSFRGLMERQKSIRVVMERQFSIGGTERRRSKESPGKRGDSAIHLAARAGNLERIKQILEEAAAPKSLLCRQNQEGETPLFVSAEKGHASAVVEMLNFLDLESASIGANSGFDPFHIAARNGHVDVLKELLSVFPNLAMTTGPSNATALLTAASQGHIDVVNLLLETNSNLAKIARNNGKTVLHSASRMGHLEVVRALLQKDPSIAFMIDRKGQTALHMAVKGYSTEIVLELLKPDPLLLHLEDSKGNSALHIAAKKGRMQIVECLLGVEGINLNRLNKGDESPLDIAGKFGPAEMVALLKEAGALNSDGLRKPRNREKQLKQTVSDIKHDMESQLQHSRQTGFRVKKIAQKLKKLHSNGLNNAINSATVVAVLIATVAFAAIFQVPGQYVQDREKDASLGEAEIAGKAPFMVFFVFDSLALFISLAVVVVQTSVVVIEHKAKKQLVFVINKLMWVACLCISVAFISLTYVVVGRQGKWLAIWSTLIGATIMLTTIGSMCYCVVHNRLKNSRLRRLKKAESRSLSFSMSAPASDPEMLETEYKRMYIL